MIHRLSRLSSTGLLNVQYNSELTREFTFKKLETIFANTQRDNFYCCNPTQSLFSGTTYFFKISANIISRITDGRFNKVNLRLGICDYKLHLTHRKPTTIVFIYSQIRFSYNVRNNEIMVLLNCDFYKGATRKIETEKMTEQSNDDLNGTRSRYSSYNAREKRNLV